MDEQQNQKDLKIKNNENLLFFVNRDFMNNYKFIYNNANLIENNDLNVFIALPPAF